MKKYLLMSAAALFGCVMSYAQKEKNYDLPEKGTWQTEVQFDPSDKNENTFKLDALKVRWFMTDKDALRLHLGLDIDTKKYTDSEDKNYKYKQRTGEFYLGLGYERHWLQKGRISVYGGAEIGFSKSFAHAEKEFGYDIGYGLGITKFSYEWKNCVPSNPGADAFESSLDDPKEMAMYSFNVNVFTGVNVHIYKGLYVGAELGLCIKLPRV